jgi:plasmid stabilization system protein ParE
VAVEYLEREWSEKEVKNFTARVTRKLEVLQSHPRHGRRSNKKKNYYRTIIHKRITLVYQLRATRKELQLITFLNNWQKAGK